MDEIKGGLDLKLVGLCVQERPEDRPIMLSVVLMLGSDSAVLPHPKQSGFVASKYSFGTGLSSTRKESVNCKWCHNHRVLDGR